MYVQSSASPVAEKPCAEQYAEPRAHALLLLGFSLSWPPFLRSFFDWLSLVKISLPEMARLECIEPTLGEYWYRFVIQQAATTLSR